MRKLLPAVLLVAILALGVLSVFVAPDHLVHQDLVPDGVERTRLRQQVRSTLLQSLLGVLVLVGAYLTWLQVRVSREGQITDRFTKAVDQIANKDKELDVRIGGIHALGRIAKDSSVDRPAIESILTTYVRYRSPWPPNLPGQYVATAELDQIPILEQRAPDIQAVLDVLALSSLPSSYREGYFPSRMQLYAVDVRRLTLFFGKFDGAFLAHSDFSGSLMDHTSFRNAFMMNCTLKNTSLDNVDLRDADLSNANLEMASLLNANLTKASLRGAKLEGANLYSANIKGAQFFGATADSRTKWPSGFLPEKHGVRLVEVE